MYMCMYVYTYMQIDIDLHVRVNLGNTVWRWAPQLASRIASAIWEGVQRWSLGCTVKGHISATTLNRFPNSWLSGRGRH